MCALSGPQSLQHQRTQCLPIQTSTLDPLRLQARVRGIVLYVTGGADLQVCPLLLRLVCRDEWRARLRAVTHLRNKWRPTATLQFGSALMALRKQKHVMSKIVTPCQSWNWTHPGPIRPAKVHVVYNSKSLCLLLCTLSTFYPILLLFLIPLMRPHLFYDLFENIFSLSRNYHQGGCNSGTELACTVRFDSQRK
jgi:hypothetical protein